MSSAAPWVGGLELTWRAFVVERSRVCAVEFGLWTLADPDAPLDQLTDDEFQSNDERMPYFGHIWASAESLVDYVLRIPRLDGQRVLDLGCGLGPCGFAAARRGAEVTFFDWEPRAIEIVALSAGQQRTETAPIHCVVGDWRSPPLLGPFDLILAADLLYEARNAPAVAEFLPRHLKPGGEAWIADPGRLHASHFSELAQDAGLVVEADGPIPHPDPLVSITLTRWRCP